MIFAIFITVYGILGILTIVGGILGNGGSASETVGQLFLAAFLLTAIVCGLLALIGISTEQTAPLALLGVGGLVLVWMISAARENELATESRFFSTDPKEQLILDTQKYMAGVVALGLNLPHVPRPQQGNSSSHLRNGRERLFYTHLLGGEFPRRKFSIGVINKDVTPVFTNDDVTPRRFDGWHKGYAIRFFCITHQYGEQSALAWTCGSVEEALRHSAETIAWFSEGSAEKAITYRDYNDTSH